MILTWRLWGALRHPAYSHPIFQRAILRITPPEAYRARQRRERIVGVLSIIVIVGTVVFFDIGTFLTFALVFGPIGYLMTIPFNGGKHALEICGVITEEQQRGRYNLLCLMPEGELHVNWLLCCAYLYRALYVRPKTKLRYLSLSMWARRWGLLVLGGVLALLVSDMALWALLGMILFVRLFLDLYYVDKVQTTILACFAGMLTAQYAAGRTDARLIAGAVHLIVQLLTFIVLTIVALVMLPPLYRDLETLRQLAIAAISTPLLLVVTIIALREVWIRLGWWLLRRRWNAPHTVAILPQGKRTA